MVKRNPLIRRPPKMTGNTTGGHKSAGILDDFAVRRNVATKEGTIEQVPTEDKHIVNKKYVDDQFPVSHSDLTNVTGNQHHPMLHAHDSHSGIGVDDHHNELHKIDSHNDTSATGTELNTLTDGSNADALHDHTEASVIVTHASTTGRTTDDHHPLTHTIVSHDTDTTGAELTSLADDSMVDALHRHSELSASDGTPNPALQVDATGQVGVGVSPTAYFEVVSAGIKATAEKHFHFDASSGLGTATNDGNVFTIETGRGAAFIGNILEIKNSANTVLSVKGNNKVGIGTTTPGAPLTVAGSLSWLDSPGNAYSVIDRSGANRRGELVFVTAGDDTEGTPSTGLNWACGVADSDEAGDGFFIDTDLNSTGAKFYITTDGDIGGTRQNIDGGESSTFTASRYLDYNNGGQMGATNGYCMMRPGSITGASLSVNVSAVTTAGTISIGVYKNGVLQFFAIETINATGDWNFSATQVRNTDTFVADDVITLKIDFVTFVGTLQDACAIGEVVLDT